ncbi:hypothetical protein Psta_2198 [Pirellula staleyi DSM 6068]|uniref:Uncharacterized protein n=1 Tax=Pirellula staleyi (strain ATCC 27377 / DSM 6068 / ICPB 4128) TaxID=530564 RepID=D2R2M9_PIRSD|nr:hypothetical protein [Pirellula staleyi]ADB16869.1 hypothetical protein Psta_2198 [Pirellula staleyi DSM 6068]
MPLVYKQFGVELMYPEGWTITEEMTDDWPRTVTLQSPNTSFWTLTAYPANYKILELIDFHVDSLREEFPDLEVLESKEEFVDARLTGVDICFFYLDLLVEAKIRAMRTPSMTLVWHYQGESREFEAMEPVFSAIATSMLRTQVQRAE